MSRVKLTVLVDQQHREQILEVVAALQAVGMSVERWMENIGVITGEIDSSQIQSIAQVEGVAAVEESQTYQLEPPSDIQQ